MSFSSTAVLFVSDTVASNSFVDQSARYRCFNLALELQRRGVRAQVTSQVAFEERRDQLNRFDHYVFHRPRLTFALADFLADVCEGRALADIDGLVFDVRAAPTLPAVYLPPESPGEARRYAASVAEAIHAIGRVTVATDALAQRVARVAQTTPIVMPNTLDAGYLGLARMLRAQFPNEARPFAFGYFAGTESDASDLELIEAAIAEVLERDGRARMLFAGQAVLPPALRAWRHRIECIGTMSPHALPYALARCRKVVAPLRRSAFTECASAIRNVEAALLGCDVVATPHPDMDRFEWPMLRRCETPAEWIAALRAHPEVDEEQREHLLCRLETETSVENVISRWLPMIGLE